MVARQPFGGNRLSGTGTKAGGPGLPAPVRRAARGDREHHAPRARGLKDCPSGPARAGTVALVKEHAGQERQPEGGETERAPAVADARGGDPRPAAQRRQRGRDPHARPRAGRRADHAAGPQHPLHAGAGQLARPGPGARGRADGGRPLPRRPHRQHPRAGDGRDDLGPRDGRRAAPEGAAGGDRRRVRDRGPRGQPSLLERDAAHPRRAREGRRGRPDQAGRGVDRQRAAVGADLGHPPRLGRLADALDLRREAPDGEGRRAHHRRGRQGRPVGRGQEGRRERRREREVGRLGVRHQDPGQGRQARRQGLQGPGQGLELVGRPRHAAVGLGDRRRPRPRQGRLRRPGRDRRERRLHPGRRQPEGLLRHRPPGQDQAGDRRRAAHRGANKGPSATLRASVGGGAGGLTAGLTLTVEF